MYKPTKEETEQAELRINSYYEEVISKLGGTFSEPLTKPEKALLLGFIFHEMRKAKETT